MSNYFSIRNGVIIKHTRQTNKNTGLKEPVELPQETISFRCNKCGWLSKSLRTRKPEPTFCICGGTLQGA